MSTLAHADQIHDRILANRQAQALDAIFQKFIDGQKRLDEMTKIAFRNMLHALAIPQEEHRGAVFRVADYKGSTRAWGLFRRETYLASLFKDFLKKDSHLKAFKNGDDPGDIAVMGDRLKDALEEVPSKRQSLSGRYSDASVKSVRVEPPAHYMASGNNAYNSYVDVPQAHKRASFWKTAGMSFLLGGVSRIAIMSALGTTAAPALAVAVAASVFTGGVTSYYRNRQVISDEVEQARANGAGFFGRLAARWRGFRKGYGVKHMALSAGMSAAGFEFGGAAVEAVTRYVPLGTLKDTFMEVAGNRIAQHAELAMDYARGLDLGVATNALASVGDATNDWVLEPTRAFLAGNSIISDANLEVARADITGGIVTATDAAPESVKETLSVVHHENLPVGGDGKMSGEEFSARIGDMPPVLTRGGNTTIVDSNSKLVNALEGRGAVSRAVNEATQAFNALTNPVNDTYDSLSGTILASNDPAAGTVFSAATPFPGNVETVYMSDGDRLGEIVAMQYGVQEGTAEFRKVYEVVRHASNLDAADITKLPVGTEVILPHDALVREEAIEQASLGNAAQTVTDTAASATPAIIGRHDVGRGDTLWKLTRTEYGLTNSADRWAAIEKIVAANAEKYPGLLKDPTALTRGWTLDLPDINNPDTASADCRVVRGRARGCTLG